MLKPQLQEIENSQLDGKISRPKALTDCWVLVIHDNTEKQCDSTFCFWEEVVGEDSHEDKAGKQLRESWALRSTQMG